MSNNLYYDVRNISSLKDMIEQSSRLFGDSNAFLSPTGDGKFEGITYTRFKSDIDALGTAFKALGLKNDFIAVMSENRYEWCTTYLATVNGTGVIVPMDKELPLNEIENLLTVSECSAIVFSGKLAPNILKLRDSIPTVKYFINMDAENDEQGFLSYNRLLESGREELMSGNRSFLDACPDPNAMSILLFTSGTTGHAKGVMLSSLNICSNIMSVSATVRIDSKDTSLSILPLHHTYECTLGFLTMIYNGGTVAFCEGLRYIGKNLKEVHPTVLVVVPLILENLYKKVWDHVSKKKGGKFMLKFAMGLVRFTRPILTGLDRKLFKSIHDTLGGRLRLIVSGAAAIDPDVSKGLRCFGFKVIQGYGLTECSPLVIGNSDFAFIDASVGRPIPNVEARIDNPGENGIGEIVVKGPNIMLGYYKNQAATDAVLQNGWFHTGDLGCKDSNGFYYITGREKNVIVTKNGKNIYPEEVETYINKSSLVQESLVWGDYDEETGETHVKAQIVPNLEKIREKLASIDISPEIIYNLIKEEIKGINKNMPLYKRIRDFSIRDNEFIKTTTKKIKRFIEEKSRH